MNMRGDLESMTRNETKCHHEKIRRKEKGHDDIGWWSNDWCCQLLLYSLPGRTPVLLCSLIWFEIRHKSSTVINSWHQTRWCASMVVPFLDKFRCRTKSCFFQYLYYCDVIPNLEFSTFEFLTFKTRPWTLRFFISSITWDHYFWFLFDSTTP